MHYFVQHCRVKQPTLAALQLLAAPELIAAPSSVNLPHTSTCKYTSTSNHCQLHALQGEQLLSYAHDVPLGRSLNVPNQIRHSTCPSLLPL